MGNGVFGASQNNYHLKYLITSFLDQDIYNYQNSNRTPKMVGGFSLRKAFSEEELYTYIGFGFHLIIPKTESPSSFCETQKQFTKDQKVFPVVDRDGRKFNIGLPCREYPESYVIFYRSLSRTWVGTAFKN